MPKRLNDELPKHNSQNVYFSDLLLWIKLRNLAEENDMTVSEIIETAIQFFLNSKELELILKVSKH